MSGHSSKKEAFSRVVIDAQLKDVGWNLSDGQSVRYEYQLPDGTFTDYVLSDRHGRAMAVVEAKRAAINLQEAADQDRADAKQFEAIIGYAKFWLPLQQYDENRIGLSEKRQVSQVVLDYDHASVALNAYKKENQHV